MTGKRHHYVPQFLQAGFSSRPGERARRAWLYRKGEATPVEATLKNIGVEVSFYRYRASGVDISADEAITRAEGQRLAPLVKRLRAARPGAYPDEAGVAELFAHVYARTKAVWGIAESQAPRLFARLCAFARDPEVIKQVLPQLVEMHRHVFVRLLAPRYPGRDIEQLLTEWMMQIQAAPPGDVVADIAPVMDSLLKFALRALQMSKVQSMQELSNRPEAALRFHDCVFHVLEFGGAQLVQGDTPVVFCRTECRGFTPILSQSEVFDYAFLPLTPTRAVVASKGDLPVSWEVLRKASVVCSYKHFIAAAPYPELNTLALTLGDDFPVTTDVQTEQLFGDALALARTPDWMGTDEVAAIEYLGAQILLPPALTGGTE